MNVLGCRGLTDEDVYLLENDIEELVQGPVDMIHGWLCDILIAKGDFDSERLTFLRDRGEATHVLPALATVEMRSYLDWRNVCLQRHS